MKAKRPAIKYGNRQPTQHIRLPYDLAAEVYGGADWAAWLRRLVAIGQAAGQDLVGRLDPVDADGLLRLAEAEGLIQRGGVRLDFNEHVRRQWWDMGYNDAQSAEAVRPICVTWCPTAKLRAAGPTTGPT